MRKEVLLGVVIVVTLFGVLIYSTLQLRQHTVEVCMSYKGRSNCSTATGTNRDEALRSATSTACGPISFGVTETIGCSRTPPARVTWID